jgi:hypothetical protein
MDKFAAFDLEIAKVVEEGADWGPKDLLGITCLCIVLSDNDELIVYSGIPQIDKSQCVEIVRKLESLVEDGYMIAGFNSLSFDLQVLFVESSLNECRTLALNHLDLFFQLFCQLGYAPGLDKLARGLRLGRKTKGVEGEDAPRMWLEGRYQEVIDYCIQDVYLTIALIEEAQRLGYVKWTSGSGKSTGTRIPGLLTVAEAMKLPEPDVSWMTNAWERSKFTGWLE